MAAQVARVLAFVLVLACLLSQLLGRVRIARHSKTGQLAAIKIISKTSLTASHVSLNRLAEEVERERLAVEREIVVMKLIDHPNIMRLYDVWETSTHLYLILEYIQGGELFDHICKYGPLSLSEALKYFHQIIGAVDYFHRFNVAHRDLKPENILLDHNYNIKIADFGMAAWQINTSGATDLMKTSCGSPHYAAPEIVRGEPYVGSSADIWSCGVILYALLTAQLPFDDDSLPELLDKVTAGKFVIPPFVDPLAQNLIKRMLVVNAKKRITMSEIFQHPFYKLYHSDGTAAHSVPELSRIAHPLQSKSRIDPDIFANLRILWHGASDDDLIKSLLNEENNWQKGIYHLLVNYRARRSVDDDSEDESERKPVRKSKKSGKSDAKKSAATSLEKRTAGQSVTPSGSKDFQPPRTGPPTPRKARDRYLVSTTNSNTEAEFSSFDNLRHLILDVQIPPFTLAENTNRFEKSKASQSFRAKKSDALHSKATRQMELVGQRGLSKLSTQAQAGDDDQRDRGFEQRRFEKKSGQLVFSIGHNSRNSADNAFMPSINTTRPLSVRRKPQRIPNSHRSDKENMAEKENELRTVDSGNCFITLSDTLSLRKKIAPGHQYGYNELGYCRHGKSAGPTDSKSSSELGNSPDNYPPPDHNNISHPKRTWLDAIFRIKSSYPTQHTLYSTWDVITTRNECRRLLMNMNIQVQVFSELQELFTDRDEESSASITLKCKMDEMEDSTGILGMMKPTKFRVEMRNIPAPIFVSKPLTEGESGSDYEEDYEDGVAVVIIHEKGSGESFREIVRRLKKEWTLEGGEVGVL